jgi:S1-C subfamily serine protease
MKTRSQSRSHCHFNDNRGGGIYSILSAIACPGTGHPSPSRRMPKKLIEVSAPVTTNLAGKSAEDAIRSVFRLIDIERSVGGTGFLHKSGRIITAAHVVTNAKKDKIEVRLSDGSLLSVTDVVKAASIPVGTQVTTWGFPMGYSGRNPLLTAGYVAGLDMISPRPGRLVPRYVVNAAFNRGNSGGPLLVRKTEVSLAWFPASWLQFLIT